MWLQEREREKERMRERKRNRDRGTVKSVKCEEVGSGQAQKNILITSHPEAVPSEQGKICCKTLHQEVERSILLRYRDLVSVNARIVVEIPVKMSDF